MSSTRVFVRLFDGASGRDGDEELLMLPPPPLTWRGVVSAMIKAVTKRADEPDEQEIGRARVFLLPSEPSGIVAELNARALRFGVRDNDQFAICLHGEAYEPSSTAPATTAASAPQVPVSHTTKLNDLPSLSSSTQPPRGDFRVGGSAPGGLGAAPGGSIVMDGSNGGLRKGSKRVRSISGKMAAIKSLGDKGIISSEDRGHLKDLLLNNDSPALQEALEHYQSTGDFQRVKELLLQELQTPSAKRSTSDWLPESLINDISLSFTHSSPNDSDNQHNNHHHSQHQQQSQSQFQTPHQQQTPANPFMYHTTAASSSGSASAATTMSSSPTGYGGETMTASSSSSSQWHPPTSSGIYAQPSSTGGPMYSHGGPQINLPLRNRHSVNVMLKQRGLEDGSGGLMGHSNGYAVTPAPAYAMPSPAYPSAMGYTPAYSYGMMQPAPTPMGYGTYSAGYPTMTSAYGYGGGMAHPGMSGYEYYSMGYGYMRPPRHGEKWAPVAPPVQAYPPPCSKEEKKEKIARWLKKREHRNWSNKPSYPVRHNIAKARKRGEDGRFITKKRLAEIAAEEAAAAQAAAATGSTEPEREQPVGDDDEEEEARGASPLGMLAPFGDNSSSSVAAM
ncbi:hypothetical protein PINS_up010083 [Pythium insidiosum]|nr:hypothetical protein PINS_up010083 [Pythium insidiosum]